MDMTQMLMNLTNLSSGYWEDYLITDEKKRAIIILRDWCIEKLKQSHPFGTPQVPIWRNRIDELSEISRVQFYTKEQQVFLNEMRDRYIQETRLNKAVKKLNDYTNGK
jgi:hypothetical protein